MRRPNGKPPKINPLSPEALAALRVAKTRVPDSATPAQGEAADVCLVQLMRVVECKIPHRMAAHVVAAAKQVRAEICGPLVQKVDVQSKGLGLAELVAAASKADK